MTLATYVKILFLICGRHCLLTNPIPFSAPSPLPVPNMWAIKAKYSLSWPPKESHITQLCQMKSKNCLGKEIAYLTKEAGGTGSPCTLPNAPPTWKGALPVTQASILQ